MSRLVLNVPVGLDRLGWAREPVGAAMPDSASGDWDPAGGMATTV
jgi:hypothetical protein